jgi:predicted transcriptional regulator
MVTKKFLRRTKRKNAFYFSPKLKQDTAETRAIGEVLNHVFDGSAQSLMLALLGHDDIGPDDLAELQELIEQKINQGME